MALKAHNDARALHGTAPLTWSDTLAQAAKQWADTCKWEHSTATLLVGEKPGGVPYGENLALNHPDIGAATKVSAGRVVPAAWASLTQRSNTACAPGLLCLLAFPFSRDGPK